MRVVSDPECEHVMQGRRARALGDFAYGLLHTRVQGRVLWVTPRVSCWMQGSSISFVPLQCYALRGLLADLSCR